MTNPWLHQIKSTTRLVLAAVLALTLLNVSVSISASNSDDTIRYTIKKGDTLWDISAKFLIKPWLWPELWEQNTYIENPHLIFPDDVLLISPTSIRLIRNNKMGTETLSPQIRTLSIHDAITTIEPSVIMPFLNQSVIVEAGSMDNSGYVLQGIHDEIILGKHSKFYAAGLQNDTASHYKLFRAGRLIIDPITDEQYGMEGVHLGDATLIASNGEVATLEITHANQEIRPSDRLIAREKATVLPHYFPRKPDNNINAQIILIPKGVNEAGRRDIVIISSGTDHQLEEGHV
ncbi:MAG: LysM peptidoglycan-binding domain-containing protein, partial [Arenicellales bacterium]